MIIGKYALESITTGMYTNPMDVLREYIQNAVDAIDTAVQEGYLSHKDSQIVITIDPLQKRVTIEDNGSGITSQKALALLTDIGNSEKQHFRNRGFRGIGRLSGLSYADSLTFRTSCLGESTGVEVKYDAKHLRELLGSYETRTQTAEATIESICCIKRFQTSESSHFFAVILDGVSADSGLLDESDVREYLCQTAPVEYDKALFSWEKVINQEIKCASYPIFLRSQCGIKPIKKPYADQFLINKTTGEKDQIADIHFSPLTDDEGKQMGMVWYSLSNFKGSIVDRVVKGLRVRVGNILLGDGQSLNHVFKDSRFNGWIVGEVHITTSKLVPNARRDDFEHNAAYYHLEEQLKKIAVEITQRIRSASVSRNKALSVALKKVDDISADVAQELSNPVITASKKGKLTTQISAVRQELKVLAVKQNEANLRSEAIDKLDLLIGRVRGATQFRAINMIEGIHSPEKSVLAKLFRNLLECYPEKEAQHCIDMILKTYSVSHSNEGG